MRYRFKTLKMNQLLIKNLFFSLFLLFSIKFVSAQESEKTIAEVDTILVNRLAIQSDSLLTIYQPEQALKKALAAKAIYT